MKIKYFIRGLGLGILVTACVLGIAYKKDVSDEEVILRAKRLGMVFADDIPVITDSPDVTQTAEPLNGETDTSEGINAEVTAAPGDVPDSEATETKEPVTAEKAKATPSVKKSDNKKKGKAKIIKFSIEKGDWTIKVAERLESLGLVDDASKFVEYLKEHDYTHKIRMGDYSIKKGADYSEIAKIITE